LTRDSYERWQKRLKQQQGGIRSMFPGSANQIAKRQGAFVTQIKLKNEHGEQSIET
jgi:hypothetical protein